MELPERVTIYEVGPRDGLQNVDEFVDTEAKVAFIDALSAAGLNPVEATSFVSPRAVPQLEDAADVMAGVERRIDVRYPVLVPNEEGLDRALEAGAEEVAIFTAASDEFNRNNIDATIPESIERYRPVAERAQEEGMWLRGYVSTAFGCPYKGEVPRRDVEWVVWELFELGCDEVSVGDTIGVADPAQVRDLLELLSQRFDLEGLALHMHDTYGRGLANVLAGLEAGITTFDTAAGGLGGCPFAPGATGNLATEDLVSLLDRMGVDTGVDLDRVVDASLALSEATGLQLRSRALDAEVARRGAEGPEG